MGRRGGRPGGIWSGAVVGVVLAAALGWWLTQPGPEARADSDPGHGRYVVGMYDYYFSPSRMTWHAGEKVTLVLVNKSATQESPGRAHEFMMGRVPRRTTNLLGVNQEDGFRQDFFTGLRVWFGDANNEVQALMPGKAQVYGSEASKFYMYMSSMGGMSGMSGASSSPSPSPSMGGSSMGGKGTEMVMKGNGLMITLDPGGQAAISFTVPDRPGTWTYGCFQQSGQHYLNGMRGTVTIVR